MKKSTSGSSNYTFLQKRAFADITWQDILLYILLFFGQGPILAIPELLTGRMVLSYVPHMLWDYAILCVATIPAWYVVFYRYRHAPMKQRMKWHAVMIWSTWIIWLGLINLYLHTTKGSTMAWKDIKLQILPVVVYYFQSFALLHILQLSAEKAEQLKKEKELADLAFRSEINALKAQIQPHFLFNTLNSISASVPAHQESTRELIAMLADTFRYSLYCSENEWVPLKEEIRFIRTVLELERTRFKDRLHFDISPLTGIENTQVPSMLLQPIVENAIKHGIAPTIDGGHISIRAEKLPGKIKITISDTGAGYNGDLKDLETTRGVGLRNTRQRLDLLFGEPIRISRNEPSGLIFSFYIHTTTHSIAPLPFTVQEQETTTLFSRR